MRVPDPLVQFLKSLLPAPPGVHENFLQRAWRLYVLVLGGIVAGWLLGKAGHQFGVAPREMTLDNLWGIGLSWVTHLDKGHLRGNVEALAWLLGLLALCDSQPVRTLTASTLLAGCFVWMAGAPNTCHIGASDMTYSILGWIAGAGIWQRKWLCLAVAVYFGPDWIRTIKEGILPSDGATISIAGHMGGLLCGFFVAWLQSWAQIPATVPAPSRRPQTGSPRAYAVPAPGRVLPPVTGTKPGWMRGED